MDAQPGGRQGRQGGEQRFSAIIEVQHSAHLDVLSAVSCADNGGRGLAFYDYMPAFTPFFVRFAYVLLVFTYTRLSAGLALL